MSIVEYASIAEIISAIAVVISLIFVGFQIRKNTKINEAATFQASAAHDVEILMKLGEDPAIARVFFTYRDDPESLPEQEQYQGAHLMAAVIRHIENIYLQYKKGMIGQESWSTREALITSVIKSPGFLKNIEVHYAGNYDGNFIKYARQQMTKNNQK